MDIRNYLLKLNSSKVVNSISGGGAGSILSIDFDNTYDLFIYSVWRIEKNEKVLATSADNTEALVGKVAQAAKYLEGKKVKSWELSKQFDLTIDFDDGSSLKIFCDVSYSSTDDGGTYDTNWELGVPLEDLYFKINNYFTIETGKYY